MVPTEIVQQHVYGVVGNIIRLYRALL